MPKDDVRIELLGAIDEAQAFLGLARAESDGELDELLQRLERDLWQVMGEVARVGGAEGSADQLRPEMVEALEREIDGRLADGDFPSEFAVPGENRLAAALDVARTMIRRAERRAVSAAVEAPLLLAYLNRLSDLCWVLARSAEHDRTTVHRPRRER